MFFCLAAYTNAAEKNRIYAGTAKIDFTPSSVADSLILDHQFIRVIAFSDGERKALLIAHETMYTRDELWEAMTKRISEETGIGREYIIMSGIHTHSGVPTGPEFNDLMMNCVKEALSKLEPVSIGVGKGECQLNMSRRDRNEKGIIILGRNPYAPCDHEVAVLRIDNERGEPISIMVNWPCHAVINYPSPRLFSGDWPSATAKFIEKEFQNKVTVPITIGASADINPLYYSAYRPSPTSSEKKAELAITAMGLGEEAKRVANKIKTVSTGKISAVQRYIALPGKERLEAVMDGNEARKPNQRIVQVEDLYVRLTALKVGNVVFAGYCGEVMTEIGMSLKEQSPYTNTFVITHCNGSVGYLVTDKALKEGGLEPARTRGMPGTAKALVDNLLEMINEL